MTFGLSETEITTSWEAQKIVVRVCYTAEYCDGHEDGQAGYVIEIIDTESFDIDGRKTLADNQDDFEDHLQNCIADTLMERRNAT